VERMRRREFVTVIGGGALAWPIAASAQKVLPVLGILHEGLPAPLSLTAAFMQGLNEGGVGQGSVKIENRWADGQYNRLPALAADLIDHRSNIIVAAYPRPDTERDYRSGHEVHEGRRRTVRRSAHTGSRLKLIDAPGRSRLKGQPSSRTGENSPYGMIGGIEETSASFEARSAPRSYLTLCDVVPVSTPILDMCRRRRRQRAGEGNERAPTF
jgi:hypothetical protein